MDLTEENVAKLPSNGSSFSSFFLSAGPSSVTSSISSSPAAASPATALSAVRLQQAKESVYSYMYRLCGLGVEGRRILRNDELYIAGQHDVRFRDGGSHAKDVDNPDYWEAKLQFFREKYEPLYDAIYPPIVIDPNSPGAIEQAEIDRGYFRWARKKRCIEAWISATSQEQQIYPHTIGNVASPSSIPPSTTTYPLETTLPRISRMHPGKVAVVVKSEPRNPKRKRPGLDHEDEHASSKRCAQAHLFQDIPATGIGEPIRMPKKRKPTLTRSPSRPVALRRSARIAALPKKKYTK
ncbi:hypothetical protein F5Y12DRAFT_428034 [Xylaria sp. FL1777]|nr:hypothetical protein F5Y12DRAFT_428034 [Xylaria sp. FL1777]